jgi:hypothetical protein
MGGHSLHHLADHLRRDGRLRECVMVADMRGDRKMHWHRTYEFPDLNDAAHAEPPPLTDDTRVTVCDNCLQASCWHGEFMCDEARGAGTIVKTVAELRKLKLENESYWL